MAQIMFLPLDERPCNYAYPLRIAQQMADIKMIAPPADMLSHKKTPADTQTLRQFVYDHTWRSDVLILPTEMLLYGGLLPSRRHHLTAADLSGYLHYLRAVRDAAPRAKIYVSSLIMRTPQYNSSDEEPDYYAEWGKKIFDYGVQLDKTGQTTTEIPADIIQDYTTRRQFNREVILALLQLVHERVIDFMVIPQDDSHPYGFTAMDQRVIYPQINQLRLNNRVLVYPGADESGYELLARAVNHLHHQTPKFYPLYSSIHGPLVIPAYEDRSIGESLKSHILVTGSTLVGTPREADVILAYNTPVKTQQEAADQDHADISMARERNLPYFVDTIRRFVNEGRKVSIADSAFANGGDRQLLTMLADRPKLLPHLLSYRAWNTNCNTLGSVLSESVIGREIPNQPRLANLVATLSDDVFYQASIRAELTQTLLPEYQLSASDLGKHQNMVVQAAREGIVTLYRQTVQRSGLPPLKKAQVSVTFPWQRMFEINCTVQLKEETKL
jgi:hypothetical protein